MTFEPKSGSHAIIEVVFGLTFNRPLQQVEIERVIAQHGRWKEWLPRLQRQEGISFSFGAFGFGGGQQIAFPSSGVVFDRLRPDGSLDWRLRVEGQNIFVNCLLYTRWAEIWPQVRGLQALVLNIIDAQDLLITQLILQYIDVFEWIGDVSSYDATRLIRVDGIAPSGVVSHGPWWHLHQGWFRQDDRLPPGRLLERVNLDAVVDEANGRPTVKIDTYLTLDLPEPVAIGTQPLEPTGNLDSWFGILHLLDKDLLRVSLSDEALDRIKLDG